LYYLDDFHMIWCNGPCLCHWVLLYKRGVPLSLSYFADAYWAEEIYMRLHICLEEHTDLVESIENNMYLPLKLNSDCFWRLPKKVLSSRIYFWVLPSSHFHHPQFIVTTKVHISLVGTMVSLGYFEYCMGLGFKVHYCKCGALMVILKKLKHEGSS
jgi:hypothetical protein